MVSGSVTKGGSQQTAGGGHMLPAMLASSMQDMKMHSVELAGGHGHSHELTRGMQPASMCYCSTPRTSKRRTSTSLRYRSAAIHRARQATL